MFDQKDEFPERINFTVMTAENNSLQAEEMKLRRLRRAMDLTALALRRFDLTLAEAQEVIEHSKQTALKLFPDKEPTWNLIYGSRFRRILIERFSLH